MTASPYTYQYRNIKFIVLGINIIISNFVRPLLNYLENGNRCFRNFVFLNKHINIFCSFIVYNRNYFYLLVF